MQTYEQFSLPASRGGRSNDYIPKEEGPNARGAEESRPASAERVKIPFDPSKLPVFCRRRLASPIEVKPVISRSRIWTPSPRSAPLIPVPFKSTASAPKSSPDIVQTLRGKSSSIAPRDQRATRTPAPHGQTRNLSSPSTTPKHIRFDDYGHPSSLSPDSSRMVTPSLSLSTPHNGGSSRSSSLLVTPGTPIPLDRGLHPPPRSLVLRPRLDLPPTPDSMVMSDDGDSECGSPPERLSIRLLSPVTPTHLRQPLPPPIYPFNDWPAKDMPWIKSLLEPQPSPTKIALEPITPPTIRIPISTLTRPSPAAHTAGAIQPIPDQPALLHHVSSDGGPVAALKRYIDSKLLEPSLSGISLFLHCPKKRIVLHSTERMARERKCAKEWSKLERMAGYSESAGVR
jgi:hypothetical protein